MGKQKTKEQTAEAKALAERSARELEILQNPATWQRNEGEGKHARVVQIGDVADSMIAVLNTERALDGAMGAMGRYLYGLYQSAFEASKRHEIPLLRCVNVAIQQAQDTAAEHWKAQGHNSDWKDVRPASIGVNLSHMRNAAKAGLAPGTTVQIPYIREKDKKVDKSEPVGFKEVGFSSLSQMQQIWKHHPKNTKGTTTLDVKERAAERMAKEGAGADAVANATTKLEIPRAEPATVEGQYAEVRDVSGDAPTLAEMWDEPARETEMPEGWVEASEESRQVAINLLVAMTKLAKSGDSAQLKRLTDRVNRAIRECKPQSKAA